MITSGNQSVRFPLFEIFMFPFLHSVYCKVFVLIDVSGHSLITCQWWSCLRGKCNSGLQRLEKKLDFFEMHTSPAPGAQKLLRHKGRKMDTASFHFRFVGENICTVSWNETFSSVGHVSSSSFLVLHSCGNVRKWIPKVIWPLRD